MTHKGRICQTLLGCLQFGSPTKDDEPEVVTLKRYKFQRLGDDKRMRTCIDLVEDSESAIVNFCKYQLSTDWGKRDLGEKYLRLYGILSAVYLQMQAIIQLADILKCPNKKQIQNTLSGLKIYEVRNIAGSHTVNFKTDKTSVYKSPEGGLNFFRLTQTDLKVNGKSLTLVDLHGNYENLSLVDLIREYNITSEKILIDITKKYVNTLCKNNNPKVKSELLSEITAFENASFDYSQLDKYKNYEQELTQKAQNLVKHIKKKHGL